MIYSALLRITKIHHFVDELVNQNKILSDCLLGEYTAIVFDIFDDTIQELNDDSRHDIEPGSSHNIKSIWSDEHVVYAVFIEDRLGVVRG